jgi:hypothetical protein
MWSFASMQEHKLQVFKNMVLRKILGSMKDDVSRHCRILYNKELNDLYMSLSIVMIVKSRRLGGEETRNAYKFFMWKILGKYSLGKPRRWEDKISVGDRLSVLEVDGTGSGSCLVAAFGTY